MGAAALTAGIFYLTAVTAGKDSAAAAFTAVVDSAPKGVLQWELGDLWVRDDLSAAAVLTLAQSPLLRTARREILWRAEEPQEEVAAKEGEAMVLEETPLVPEESGGSEARTLVPSSEEGYVISGRAYITNTSDHTITEEEVSRPFAAQLGQGDPQILILHTHGSESYTPPEEAKVVWSGDYRTTDTRYNVVAVGDVMAEVFGAAGISVLHDRTLYDYPSYNGAYDRSLASIEDYLARYPSIRFVLDLHRDAVEDTAGNQYRVICETQEGTAAQMTLVVGSDGGGLYHPNWQENLRLATALQEHLLAENEQLMRPVLLRNSRYNQHVTTGSLLVEVGAAGNSPEEATLAARIFAEGMIDVITGTG